MRRLDSPDKVTGKAQFGMDVRFPGLRTALVARSPVFGGKVKSFDPGEAKSVKGVEQVVQVPTGVAVVASNFWSAKRGRDALLPRLEWDLGPGATLDSAVMFQTMDQMSAAKIGGVPPENVSIHTQFLGGGFGRRATPSSDFVSEAVQVAKAAGVPVKTVWTREDDIQGGFYRPLFVHHIEVGLDGKGSPVAWKHTIVGQSILAGTPFEQFMVKDGVDATSVEGVSDSPYLETVPARLVTVHSPKQPVPVLWWRSVGNTHTAFAMESMVDELAHASGREPLEFRAALLAEKPRHLRALKAAAELAGWGKAPPSGRARGLAVHESFGSIIAQVAEVSVDEDKEIHVHKVACAVDCGTAINPLGIEAQVQGAIAFGLSAVLHSELSLKDGRVEQSNFHDYRVLRLPDMPEIEVHVIESD